MNAKTRYLKVMLDVPLAGPFDYLATATPQQEASWEGIVIQVPWGTRQLVGIVVEDHENDRHVTTPINKLRTVTKGLHKTLVLPKWWLSYIEFAAKYYHREQGELVLPTVPRPLRTPHTERTRESTKNTWEVLQRATPPRKSHRPEESAQAHHSQWPALTVAQTDVLQQIQHRWANKHDQTKVPTLLRGVTGSGKTEIYLHLIAQQVGEPSAATKPQTLFLLPEIALTPQFVALIQARFPSEHVVALHSAMTDTQRAKAWAAAVTGHTRIIVGTRLAVLTPFAKLGLIIVDEEHDPSYKQAEGVHYSARDLAVALGQATNAQVILGSATPSLESWRSASQGKYRLEVLEHRALSHVMPNIQTLNVRGAKLQAGLHPLAIEQIRDRLARKEQSLLFLNRRGFSPVLHCSACVWTSQCDHCSSYRVLHRLNTPGPGKPRHRLACHHCGQQTAVPRACPQCGNLDLTPMGKGTQRLEQELQELLPQARIDRLDRDVANKKGAALKVIGDMHDGSIDILVGTQMLAKGHNFERLTLVVVIDADNGLYASDFRAPERLFANLMQVAGRAGRTGLKSDVLVQTSTPDHPLFASLKHHDYLGFATQQLKERQHAQLPPYTHQALFRAQSKTLQQTMAWLQQSRDIAQAIDPGQHIQLYDPVPMPLMRKAGMERAQLLIESASRPALHRFLRQWLHQLREQKTPVQWQLEIDPQEI